jgi:hypothetical protein
MTGIVMWEELKNNTTDAIQLEYSHMCYSKMGSDLFILDHLFIFCLAGADFMGRLAQRRNDGPPTAAEPAGRFLSCHFPGQRAKRDFCRGGRAGEICMRDSNWQSWERLRVGWTIGVWAQPDAIWKKE